MKPKSRKLSILLIVLIFVIGSFIILNHGNLWNTNTNNLTQDEKITKLKISGTYENITINNLPGSWNNWTWAKNQVWCSGLGTLQNPYIIQDHIIGIKNSADGIKISNSHGMYFIIESCTILWNGTMPTGTEKGIHLSNSTNGIINNNVIYGIGSGVNVDECESMLLKSNTVYNSMGGIALFRSDFCKIMNNTIFNTENGINLFDSEYNTVNNNTANSNEYGLYVTYGFYNNIHENILDNNNIAGVHLAFCEYNNITENEAHGNIDGIFLESECDKNLIIDNICNNNDIGIEIYYSDHNDVEENYANNNYDYGIRVEGSNNNTINGNDIKNNSIYGMIIEVHSDNNTIYRNSINDNADAGIFMTHSEINNIIGNTMDGNGYGIHLDIECYNNSIYENLFLKNGIHAIDNGIDNKWNSSTIGNYWDNHTGPDNNNDGIVDIPYTNIRGSADSIDYLPISEEEIIISRGLDPGLITIIVILSIAGAVIAIGSAYIVLKERRLLG
ncbi:MAG: nitrous oxide reductase family maturation protein NosD [Candidatus Hermodarchaeota archaeon]